MTMHLCAFGESIDPAGALVNIAGITDDAVLVNGDDIRVPTELPWFLGGSALISATTPIQAQFQSPSLRQVANIDIDPVATGLVFDDPAEIAIQPMSPLPLNGDEALNFLANTNPAGAEIHYGLAWLGDGAIQPVVGEIYSVRAMASLVGVALSWVSSELTFAQDLPVGNYEIVGMRCREAGMVAARLSFRGQAFRPGVPGAVAINDVVGDMFRYGKMGSFGIFHTNTPPLLEVIAAAAAINPVVILDLIFRG